jgi:hypothetical protein
MRLRWLYVAGVGAAAATQDGDRGVLCVQAQVIVGQLHWIPGVESWRLIEFGVAHPGGVRSDAPKACPDQVTGQG